MSMFNAINVSSSGIRTFRAWMDATADNLANTRAVAKPGDTAFQPILVIAEAVDSQDGTGGGSRVNSIQHKNNGERLEFDPGHPYADAEGLVHYSGVDMADEMTNLIAAQRGYQANLTALDKVRSAYESALRIGR